MGMAKTYRGAMNESDFKGERAAEQRHQQPNSIPMLYDPAPDFTARTTSGEISLSSFRGKWLVFFSHPADFTPVCTSEIIGFAKYAKRFREHNCELLGLSLDSLYSHLAWMRNISDEFKVEIGFPLVEDPSMSIARAYGMIRANATSSATVRGVFLIDPTGIIRSISFYPTSVGRNVEEILRLLIAIQTTDEQQLLAPEGWAPGDDLLMPPPTTADNANINADCADARTWYFRTKMKK
jgi:peroxiredoxin (alkyl hydroperoxide reductase subunit C)